MSAFYDIAMVKTLKFTRYVQLLGICLKVLKQISALFLKKCHILAVTTENEVCSIQTYKTLIFFFFTFLFHFQSFSKFNTSCNATHEYLSNKGIFAKIGSVNPARCNKN